MKRLCVIGLDLGTTSAKAAAFDENDVVIATASCAVTTDVGKDGRAEQHPEEIATAALEVLVKAAEFAVNDGYEVEAVGFSTAMHSLIVLDDAGHALTNAIIWMDGRPNTDAMALRASDDWRALYAATGTPIHAMTPLAKLLWLRREQPEMFARAARFVSLKEYVWAQWFGEWVIDESMAGATGMYALESRNWDEGALRRTGVQVEQLSRIVPTTYLQRDPIHPALVNAGLSRAAFNIGASDGVLANLGVGATDSSSMVLTIGTSCAVRLTTEAPLCDYDHQPFSYVLDDKHYVVGGPSNSGGVVVDWMANGMLAQVGGGDATAVAGGSEGHHADVIASDDNLNVLLEAAASVDTGDLLCLPYMAGERAPLWDADMSGSLIGLGLHHTPAHVFRATLEGVLLNAYWIAESLTAAGNQPERLVASGKVLCHPFVRQLCADIFNLPVVFTESTDASARGAALLARLAMGRRTYASVGRVGQEVTVTPDEGMHAAYLEKYARFRKVSAALVGLMK